MNRTDTELMESRRQRQGSPESSDVADLGKLTMAAGVALATAGLVVEAVVPAAPGEVAVVIGAGAVSLGAVIFGSEKLRN